jgi:Zn-dependent protease
MGFDFNPAVFLIFPVMLFSLSVHECAHALVAWWGGDDTSRLQGRITLNPISHIDVFGTLLIPIIAAVSSLPLIGWAKPVPVNISRLKRPWWDVLVTLAGPGSNLLLALVATVILRFTFPFHPEENSPATALGYYFIVTNVSLFVFNLLPIPPLDGSRVVFHYFVDGRPNLYPIWDGLERFSIIFLYLIITLTVTRNLLQVATRGLLDPMFTFIGW